MMKFWLVRVSSALCLGSVHKYFGGGAGQNGGGAKTVLSYQKGGTKKFSLVKGGVKKVWSN